MSNNKKDADKKTEASSVRTAQAAAAGSGSDLNTLPFGTRARPYFIVLPSLIITIGIMIPFIMSIYYSLTNYSFRLITYKFIWFQNWIKILSSGSFWHACLVTLEYAGFAVLFEMLIGLGVAMLLNTLNNGFSRVLKVALIFPLMIAPVVATIIWVLMLSNTVGIVEKLLNIFGVYGFPWQASTSTAMGTAIMIDVWVNTPFCMLLSLAGLQSLPKSPFESAQIDGGSNWFNFKNLTLPLIKPSLLIALLFRLMAALQEYAIIFGLTKGGPGDRLMNLSLTAYQTGFQYQKFGFSLPYILVLWAFINFIANKLVKAQRKAVMLSSGAEE